jgi:hypothetical protein
VGHAPGGRLGIAGGERSHDDQDQDVGRGQRSEPGPGPGAGREPGDNDGEFTARDKRAAGRAVGFEAGHQLGRGVLQAQREQQQDHADFCAGRDELLAGAERKQPPVTEGESGQQVQGNRRLTEASG